MSTGRGRQGLVLSWAHQCSGSSHAGLVRELKSGSSRLISSCKPSCLHPSPSQPRSKRSTAHQSSITVHQTSITAVTAKETSPVAALGTGIHGSALGA